jgi:hypothetical protein
VQVRTSTGTFFDNGFDDVISAIEERVAQVTMLPKGEEGGRGGGVSFLLPFQGLVKCAPQRMSPCITRKDEGLACTLLSCTRARREADIIL